MKTASWHSTNGNHNAFVEETRILSFSINHKMNAPAECIIILNDDDQTAMAKYNVDADDVYLGSGYVWVEYPTATPKFKGRIIKARHDTMNHQLILYCKDWSDQLNDHIITSYDSRLDLDGTGTRISYAASDPNSPIIPAAPVYTSGVNYYLWDNAIEFDTFSA